MPDHRHSVWTLPEGHRHFPARWGAVCAWIAQRTDARQPRGASREGHMAAAVLGAPYPGRSGLRGACPVLLDQPGQTWVCRTGRGLAVFVDSSGYRARHRGVRMVGRHHRRRVRRVGWVKPTIVARVDGSAWWVGTHPTLAANLWCCSFHRTQEAVDSPNCSTI